MSPRTGGTRDVDPRPGGTVLTSGGKIPIRYPDWRQPPLPGGPVQPTPPGSSTVRGATARYTLAASAGEGYRIPILYGRCRITPDIVKTDSYEGMPSFQVVISEGPIDSVEDWLYEYQTGNLTVSLGSLSPTEGLPPWSIGLACAAIQAEANNLTIPHCVAKGRKVFDPRLGAWGAGEYPDSAYCAFSTNPALILADLRTFPQYGDLDPANVDWESVEDAADWCDELISGVKRYEFQLYLQAGKTADQWLDTVSLHCGIQWRESAGLWRLDYVDSTTTVTATITEDHLVEDSRPSVRYGSGAGLADMPNRFTVEYTIPESGLNPKNFDPGFVTVQHPEVDAGAAPRDAEPYVLQGIQNSAQAMRALQRIASDIWSEVELDMTLTLDMLHLEVGHRVTVNIPSLGLIDVDFRITRVAYDADSVRVTASLYAGDTWTAPDEEDLAAEEPVGAGDPLDENNPTLPPTSPPAPTAPPQAPIVLAPPPEGVVPVYRRIAEDPPPADGEVATWDAATKTVYFAPCGGAAAPVLSTEGFVATADQTDFVLAYTPLSDGIVYITRNGVVARTGDWSLSTATVTFGTGLLADTDVQVCYWRTAPTGTTPIAEGFTATAGQTDFTLAHVARTVFAVALNGVVQKTTNFVLLNGVTIRLIASPVAGDDVWISYLY